MRTSTAVLFLDLQDEIVKNSRTVPFTTLAPRIVTLTKLATIHHLPVFISSVAQGGALVAEVSAALPDEEFNAALAAIGPKRLILCGVTSEVVIQRTALEALGAGYEVQIAVDACGGIDTRTEDASWQRIVQAGGVLTSIAMVAAELAGDFRSESGQATFGVLRAANDVVSAHHTNIDNAGTAHFGKAEVFTAASLERQLVQISSARFAARAPSCPACASGPHRVRQLRRRPLRNAV